MARSTALFLFSNNPDRYLDEVMTEMKAADAAFNKVLSLCAYKPLWKPSPKEIKDFCRNFPDEVPIFHFTGHARPGGLQLNEDDDFAPKYIFTEGLAETLCIQFKTLKLVFLNGCSTREQAKCFLDLGVPAVIATTRPVRDKVACQFAKEFYENFLNLNKPCSLDEAFKLAKSGLVLDYKYIFDPQARKFNSDLLDPERSSLDEEEGEEVGDGELYQLHLNEKPEFAGFSLQTFSEWVTPKPASAPTIPKTEPGKDISFGVEPESYLLCNRATEADYIQNIIAKKMAGEMPEPYFFVIHELEEDCPQLLSERIERYGIPKADTKLFHEIELPKPSDFGLGDPTDPANVERDRFKIRLSELYKDRFGGAPASENKLCTLTPRPETEPLLIVHHYLSPSRWHKPGNPAENELLHKKIEALFRFYLGDYGQDLQKGFSKRLVVIFSIEYLQQDDFFPGFFKKMENEYKLTRFRQIGELDEIYDDDIRAWQKVQFENPAFITISEFFKIDEQRTAPPQPMKFLIPKLIAEIKRFNAQFNPAAHARP